MAAPALASLRAWWFLGGAVSACLRHPARWQVRQIERHSVPNGRTLPRERTGRNERKKVIESLDLLAELLEDEQSKILGHV